MSNLCTGWFFGGVHQWPRGTAPCSVKRRQKPPYQNRWTSYHEWKGKGLAARCIHCLKTRQQVLLPSRESDCCLLCGLSRKEVKRLNQLDLQPRLSVDHFKTGPLKLPPSVIRGKPALRLIVDNTSGGGAPSARKGKPTSSR